MRVLTVNVGSSSVKLRALDAHDAILVDRELRGADAAVGGARLDAALDDLPPFDAVAHRIVHGGQAFRAPSPSTIARSNGSVSSWTSLPCTTVLRSQRWSACARALPELPHVACFDTAFHAGMPEAAAAIALPREWVRRFGLRRYGFHGLSHAYVARRTSELVAGRCNGCGS